MIEPLSIPGAFLIHHTCHADERGWFQRLHCERELRSHGLVNSFPQSNASFTEKRLSVRGLHLQRQPFAETKIVSCLQGKVFDVIVDLRRNSSAFGQHTTVHLSAGDGRSIYIPSGCAHGFQTLSENVILNYLMSEMFHPEASFGVNWLDHDLAIPWPSRDKGVVTISEKDHLLPRLAQLDLGVTPSPVDAQ